MRSKSKLTVGLLLACLFSGNAFLRASLQEGRGEDIHFRGPVLALSRDSSDRTVQLTIKVNQSQVPVAVTDWTEVVRGRGFLAAREDIQVGDFLEIAGFFSTTGRIVAQRVHIETQDDIELEGTVENVSGNLLRISGVDFIVDPDTYVHAAGGRPSILLTSIALGTQARVRGSEDGGLWLAREIEVGPRTVESEPVRFSGKVVKIERLIQKDYLHVDVGIRSGGDVIAAQVVRDQQTLVQGTIQVGSFVEAEARFMPGSSQLQAVRIAVDLNGNGNSFDDVGTDGPASIVEIKGTLHGLSAPTAGSVTFFLNETQIRVQSGTALEFENGQSATLAQLQEGAEVWVLGTLGQDGSVIATRIVIRGENGNSQGNPDPGDPGSGGGSGDDNGNGSGGDDPGHEGSTQPVDLDGVITSVSRLGGSLSVKSFELDGKTVVIVETTVIQGEESEVLPSSILEVGIRVKVKGEEQSNGSIVATRIELVES